MFSVSQICRSATTEWKNEKQSQTIDNNSRQTATECSTQFDPYSHHRQVSLIRIRCACVCAYIFDIYTIFIHIYLFKLNVVIPFIFLLITYFFESFFWLYASFNLNGIQRYQCLVMHLSQQFKCSIYCVCRMLLLLLLLLTACLCSRSHSFISQSLLYMFIGSGNCRYAFA